MKAIKASLVIAFALTITTAANAQNYNYKLDGPFTVIRTFKVSGTCEMCKHRVENGVRNIPGVWFSNWDIPSETLQVKYDRIKVSEDKIEQRIAALGNDTEKFKASDQAYAKLPDCCHYRKS